MEEKNTEKKFTLKKKVLLAVAILLLVKVLVFDAHPQILSFILPHKKGDFVRVGNMNAPRGGHWAVLLNDGRVLIIGGYLGSKPSNHDQSTLFNPLTNSYTEGPRKNKPWIVQNAIALPDGKILVTGWKNTEIFNPISNTFTQGPDLIVAKKDHGAILTNDGKVLIIGGLAKITEVSPKDANLKVGQYLKESNEIEAFDPKTNKVSIVGATNIARRNPQLFILKSGEVIILNGFNNTNAQFVREIELFNPKIGKCEIIAKRTSVPKVVKATLLPDDTILLTGGSTGFGIGLNYYPEAEIFNPKTGEFYKLKKGLNKSRPSDHSATVLKGWNVLITGGGERIRSAEIYMFNDKIGE